jgi:MFS family permease
MLMELSSYAAAILGTINEDIGPDPRYVWISLVYSTTLAVCLAPVGRLSDIFGRRYFFIGGGIIAVIGSIVCATASNILTLIGGNVLLGVATATQLSFHFVMGELVPIRYRYIGNAGLYVFTLGGSGMGPAISTAFVVHYPSVGWRGVYWLLLAINGAALVCWVLFYFPPSFHEKHRSDQTTKTYWIKNFDYVGTFLFASGFTVFLLGLSWGGSVYPWKSVAVVSSIVLGFLTIVGFVLWEIYAPIKEPLIPMHLFLMGRWTASVVLLGLGAGIYYAFSVVWPTQVAVMYGDGDLMYIGYVSLIGKYAYYCCRALF